MSVSLCGVARSVGGGRRWRGRPATTLRAADELCEGLGAGLPAPDHQGNAVLDRGPAASASAAAR